VLHALDDPFIRFTPQTREALTTNPAIRLIETDHAATVPFWPGLWGRGPTERGTGPKQRWFGSWSQLLERRMEADWEVEIGRGAPVIDALWEGFVDLSMTPERINEIEEARDFPPLRPRAACVECRRFCHLDGQVDAWANRISTSRMEAPELRQGRELLLYRICFQSGQVFASVVRCRKNGFGKQLRS